jgi:NAD(P)-dependent dehydrogenase (short-subunit alcohol dehydrogenase family)
MTEPAQREFLGKTVVVTGGNSGMGRAIALGFAARGAIVIVADRAAEPALPWLPYRPTDVSQPAQVERLIGFAVEQHGRLDVLVNNAGINGPLVPLAEQPLEAVDAVFGVNLKGVFHGLKYGLAAMVAGGGGVIVNIASVQGIRPIYAGASIYAASKAAVVSLKRTSTADTASASSPSRRGRSIRPCCAPPTLTAALPRPCPSAASARRRSWPRPSCGWPATARAMSRAHC